jgi:hypothetical protein
MPERQAFVRVWFIGQERPYSARILAARGLNLDHIRTKVRHQFPAKLTLFTRNLYHPQTVERTRWFSVVHVSMSSI